MNPVFSLLTVFLVLTLPATAQEIGTLTLVGGPLRIIRGTTVLQGAEGVRLYPDDMLESANAGFVQFELTRGPIVVLGGSTRVFLLDQTNQNAAELVLLSGWLKEQGRSGSGACRLDSPLLAAATKGGTLLLHSTPEAAEIFVESGTAQIGEVNPEGNWRDPRLVKAGQFSSRRAGKGMTVAPRFDPPFVEAMPRQFRDTFPPLLSRFTGKPPQPKRDHEVTYSEIQPWLTMGQVWRRGFVHRFRPCLNDPAFRTALESHLAEYPEWGPVLHPELYAPRTSPRATGNPGPENGRNSN